MLKKILLPIDSSKTSDKAIEYVISSPNLNDVDIIVLNVIESSLLDSIPQVDIRKSLITHLCEERVEAVRKITKKIEDGIEGNGFNINLFSLIKKGIPKDVILKTANELGVDHIIMAKSGKHVLEKVFMGSTTEKVVRISKVPVIVIS